MPLSRTGVIERQARDHGYTIKLVVDRKGQAVVTLTGALSGPSFSADSGEDTTLTRYETALAIAVDRMLDYEYRSTASHGGRARPKLGELS